MSRILIAEDEAPISSFIEKACERTVSPTTVVGSGVQALALARSGEFDLMILDIGLPELDGFAVLHALRSAIGRSARPHPHRPGRGRRHRCGTARWGRRLHVETVPLRRAAGPRPAPLGTPSRPGGANTLTHNGISLDLHTRRLHCDGNSTDLTAREFTLIQIFLTHPGQVLSREQLLSRVWGYDYEPGSNIVETYIRYLRRKVGPDRIETVRGMGYRLRD